MKAVIHYPQDLVRIAGKAAVHSIELKYTNTCADTVKAAISLLFE